MRASDRGEGKAWGHGPNFGVGNVVIYRYDLATFENGGVQFAGQGGGGTPWVSAASGYTLQGSHLLGIGFDTVATRIDDESAMFERSASSGITDFDGDGRDTNMMGNGFRRISGRYNEKGYLSPSRLGSLQAGR